MRPSSTRLSLALVFAIACADQGTGPQNDIVIPDPSFDLRARETRHHRAVDPSDTEQSRHQAHSRNPNAAVLIRDGGCTLFDGDGNFVSASDDMTVSTSSGQGTIRCRVKGVQNSTGRAVTYDTNDNPIAPGTTCFIPLVGSTTKWHETVSASGVATLICQAEW